MSRAAASPRVVVLGAGVGGLAAAIELRHAGARVDLWESTDTLGGKVRTAEVGAHIIDVGPTVLTMPWVFRDLFARVGADFDGAVPLRRATRLGRHFWARPQGGVDTLDLYHERERSRHAIGELAGSQAVAGFDAFCDDAARIYAAAEQPFIRAPKPGIAALMRAFGPKGDTRARDLDGWRTMWRALSRYFADPRLRQLFGRYATYYGASPFAAPATLNLIAHVEMEGVYYVQGGMRRLIDALEALAARLGVEIHRGRRAMHIATTAGRTSGVTDNAGLYAAADAIIYAGDVAALAALELGPQIAGAAAPVPLAARSLSALTIAFDTTVGGAPLIHHNVFFGPHYAAEFEAIFQERRLPRQPTVYLCAQGRADEAHAATTSEPLFAIINAPAVGDTDRLAPSEVQRCQDEALALLRRCGLSLTIHAQQRTTPRELATRYPATGGALYGRLSHGFLAPLRRMGARSRIGRLYLAGGSVHPGAGLPMATLSGHQAAVAVAEDLALPIPSPRAATAGGTSTR